MNKGSKESFLSLFSHCQVIFTLGPSGSAQCHTHQLHMTAFFLFFFISGTWGGALVSLLKPFYQICSRADQEHTYGINGKYSPTEV